MLKVSKMYWLFLLIHNSSRVDQLCPATALVTTRCRILARRGMASFVSLSALVSEIRGVLKKFAAQPKRKTSFTTKRGVRDVTLLKRPLTQPLANRSSCFAQAVGCCKNVCYFVERSDARQGAVIPFVVLQKCVARVIHEDLLATPGEYYLPYKSAKARIELFKVG